MQENCMYKYNKTGWKIFAEKQSGGKVQTFLYLYSIHVFSY